MLHLYQSNQLENLAQMMLNLHQSQPLSHPLQAEYILVQSQGMRRYINQYWAQHSPIAANLHFELPAQLAWQLMREALPNAPKLSPFSSDVMQWRLLQLFQSRHFAEDGELASAQEMLRDYVQQGEMSAYQLARQLADVFDQYLMYRPDWIEAWSNQQNVAELSQREDCAQEQQWQAAIWRELLRDEQRAPHRAQMQRVLMDSLANQTIRRLPERILMFGITALAPSHLQLLQEIAKQRDVHIFALNPSAMYWGDLLEPAQILQQTDDVDLSLQGHPLLASWGKQGRNFFNDLSVAEARQDEAHQQFAEQAKSPNLLHSLQYQIQQLVLPEQAHDDDWLARHDAYLRESVLQQNLDVGEYYVRHVQQDLSPEQKAMVQLNADSSLHIHSAHSSLRELQILKDRILLALAQNPTWQPHDIAVLTPNIEPYAPFIDSVFGEYSDAPLPYSLADVKLTRKQPALDALAQALDLLNSRFEAEQVLALLNTEPVLQQWHINRADLPLLHSAVAELNIRWGSDASERAQYGDANNLFTWQQGLDRLVLGWLQPAQSGATWQNIAPHTSHPDHLPILANFVAFVRFLSHTKQQWQQPASVAQWCERLQQFTQTLLGDGDTTQQAALQTWRKALDDWQEQAEIAQFSEPLSSPIACQHIRRSLDEPTDAGLLRGGITFCSMVPMRSLPFKMLCLLGLNDGTFPRNTKAAPFDLIAKQLRKGDRSRRDDDRYLFLEAILSAREQLYLSYIGRDIRSDAERAPSTLLSELVDTISALSDVPSSDLYQHWVTHHPLQAFSRRYFASAEQDNPHLSSTRSDFAHALNLAQQGQTHQAKNFVDWRNTDNDPATFIRQKDFLRFWRNPVRHWLHHTLNWQSPYFTGNHESEEPFLSDQPRRLDDAYVQARMHNQSFDDTAAYLRAQSLLPAGELGKQEAKSYEIAAKALDTDLLNSPRLPHRSGELACGQGSLHFDLSHNHEAGQILLARDFLSDNNTHGKLTSPDQVQLLLQHLIYCAATPDHEPVARQTHYVSLTQQMSLPPMSQAQAQAALSVWLAYYAQGQQAPLPYFARVNWAAAMALYTKKDANWLAAQDAAADKYHAGYFGMAQEDYPEVQLVFGRDPDAEPPYTLPEFQQITEDLFEPLQVCLQVFADDKDKK